MARQDYYDRVCAYPNTKVRTANTVSINDLWKSRLDLAIPHKKWRLARFYEAFSEITEALARGHVFTREEITNTRYWDYIRGYRGRWMQEPMTSKANREVRHKFWSGVHLFQDIKENGMRDPLAMITERGKTFLYRGYRRLVILKSLKTKVAKVNYAIVHNSFDT